MSKRTILLYGRTRSGKSTQVGSLAEHLYKTKGLRTRLYTADRGGYGPIMPYVELGIIEAIEMGGTDPFIFLNNAAKGNVRDNKGKWVPGLDKSIGMYVFESMTAFGDELMSWMATKSGEGVSIGGGSNTSFIASGDDQVVKISGSNMAHYGVAQARITKEVWQSQKLEAEYIVWTASVAKDEDSTTTGKVLGPLVCGKALTAEIPRWFNLTFRMDCLPAKGGQKERHLLYMGNHEDVGAGNAVGLGNTRLPLDAGEPVKNVIEPASIVEALNIIDGGYNVALEKVRARLGMKAE